MTMPWSGEANKSVTNTGEEDYWYRQGCLSLPCWGKQGICEATRLDTDGLKKEQIFYDEISLQPGDELDNIIKVIESASMKLFVFVVSKYCFQSNKTWIRAEWEAALENNKQIFPIWLDDNNDGFKAFGNLVREFSYKLRKVIAQRVNPQEISTSLPGLSEKICFLVCDVLPAKLKLEFVQKVYNQLLDKAEALFDDITLDDEECLQKADKIFQRYKARIESIIPGGCFIFNLRFFQPCNVDDFYHDHFRVGPASLSAALTRLLVTDQMRAAAGGEELMVRVEVRYDDYVRVRRQLHRAGILKATSVDNLSPLAGSSTDVNLENPTIEGLDLAITSIQLQDSRFSEWAAHPVTRHLAHKMRQKSQHVTTLEGRLEMAKHQGGIHEAIVKSLHKEVTHLNEKDESAQKVLLNKTEEIKRLQETNRDINSEIEELRNAKSKHVIALEGKLETAKNQAGVQEDIVKNLQKEVTHLNKKDEATQNVLLNKTEEIKQLQKTNRDLEKENEELRNTKLKWPIKGLEEVSAKKEAAWIGQSILVSGLPDFPTEETADDKITLYFQSRAQSSGGDVRTVQVNTATRQAVVTFQGGSVAQSVLAQPVHILNNTRVLVEAYSAGSAEAVRVDQAAKYFYFIKEEVSTDWGDLAIHLGFKWADIRNIRDRNRDDKSCCMDMLWEWQRREGDAATIEVLMEALSEAELRNVLDGFRIKFPELKIKE